MPLEIGMCAVLDRIFSHHIPRLPAPVLITVPACTAEADLVVKICSLTPISLFPPISLIPLGYGLHSPWVDFHLAQHYGAGLARESLGLKSHLLH